MQDLTKDHDLDLEESSDSKSGSSAESDNSTESRNKTSSNNSEYKRWTDSDKERLRRMHKALAPEKRSSDFYEKLANMYGKEEGRTTSAIQEECRRLGLKPKRFPKSPICTNPECGVWLVSASADTNTASNRVGNFCKTCYGKLWIKNNKK